MKSKLYKMILNNKVIAEGSAYEIRRKVKTYNTNYHDGPNAFVGMGSPHSTLGEVWNKAFPA